MFMSQIWGLQIRVPWKEKEERDSEKGQGTPRFFTHCIFGKYLIMSYLNFGNGLIKSNPTHPVFYQKLFKSLL